MLYRIILLALLTLTAGCTYEVAESPEDDMPIQHPPVAKVPISGVTLVAPVIPKSGMWSGNNQLGREAAFAPNAQNEQTILKLDEWGPPEVWTVSLYLKDEVQSFNGYSVVAEVNFGAGGSTQEVEVDWINGTQFSVPMNAINVVARFDGVDVTTEGRGLRLGVQIARGARSGGLAPVRTIAENLAIGAGLPSSSLLIPKFTGQVRAYPCTTTDVAMINAFYSDDLILSAVSGNAAAHAVASINGLQLGAGIALPITGEARRLLMQNSTAVPINTSIIAELVF